MDRFLFVLRIAAPETLDSPLKGIVMDQSLRFVGPDATSRALRTACIWSELLEAMPIVLFIGAVRRAWALHRAEEAAARGR